MKKPLSILLAVLALCLATPAVASAHVLKTDGDNGAILHILPDDAPVAKTPVSYELSFDAGEHHFSLKDCNCSIAFIAANGKTVAVRPLVVTSPLLSENNTFTFPEADVYTFRVSAAPTASATFTPFQLDYTVRVGSGQSEMQPVPLLLWIGIGMGAGLILLYANVQGYDDRTNHNKAHQTKEL